MAQQLNHLYEFGPYRIDRAKRLLFRGQESVQLPSKAFETLLVLIQHRAEVVSKEVLMRNVWPDTFVEESNLTQTIFVLRKALGETSQDHRYIVTVPGQGYCFAEKVKELQEAAELVGLGQTESRPSEASDRSTARTQQRRTVLLAAMAVGMFATAVGSYLAWHHFRAREQVNPGKILLAVLPFENLTGDHDQEYLSDGFTEEMITQLGGLYPERLGVIARTSVMGYKHANKRLDQIGHELGAQYVLQGSLRRSQDRIRITAQLIQLSDQSQLWAQDYDRKLQDVLTVQDEVAASVASQVQLRLPLRGSWRVLTAKKPNPDAYDLRLRGRYALNKRTSAELQKSVTYFQEAIKADPEDAQAYTGLAESYVLLPAYGMAPEGSVFEARASAQKALALDETLSEPHAILALIAQNHDWNWDEAERQYKLAMVLDPNYATAHHWYAEGLATRGRFVEALDQVALACQLDPVSLVSCGAQADILYYQRRYDEAVDKWNRILEIEPAFAQGHLMRGLAYEQKGMWKEALTDLETALSLDDSPRSLSFLGEAYALAGDTARAKRALNQLRTREKYEYVSPLYPALIFAGLGDKDEAFSRLEGACRNRSTDLLGLKVAGVYDPLRADPRFPDLLHRVGLAP